LKTLVKKDELVAIVKDNRDNHRTLFEEALEAYRKRAQTELDKYVARLSKGDPVKVSVHMFPPEDHTDDYERALRMLDLDTRSEIELDEEDSAQFLMDDWGWTNSFADSYTSNTLKTYKRYK
jgi:hypothetical protein